MLVIAYKAAVRIGGKGGLTGAGKAEEQRAVALRANVGGAMHGEHALLGKQIVHHGEYALLYFARILAAGNYNGALVEIDYYCGLAVHAVHFGGALEAGGCDYGEAGNEVLELLLGRTDKQLMDEQVLAGKLVNNAHGQMILLISTGKAFEHEQLAALQVSGHAVIYGFVLFFAYGNVYLAPIYIVVNIGRIDHEAVVGGTAGIFAGGHYQRAGLAQRAFAAAKRMLYKLCRRKILVHGLGRDYAKRLNVITHFQIAPFNVAR